jgi:hypothetical protein
MRCESSHALFTPAIDRLHFKIAIVTQLAAARGFFATSLKHLPREILEVLTILAGFHSLALRIRSSLLRMNVGCESMRKIRRRICFKAT